MIDALVGATLVVALAVPLVPIGLGRARDRARGAERGVAVALAALWLYAYWVLHASSLTFLAAIAIDEILVFTGPVTTSSAIVVPCWLASLGIGIVVIHRVITAR